MFSLKKAKTHFDIDLLRLQSPYGILNVVASVDKDVAKASYLYKISTLDIGSEKNIFALTEQAAGQIVWPRIDIDSLQLRSGTAQVGMSGMLNVQGDSSVTFTASELSSDQLPSSLLGDRFGFQGGNSTIFFEGPLHNPSLRGKGNVTRITAPQLPFPIQGNFDIAYRDSRVTLDHFLWTSADGIRLEATGTVPFQPGIEDMLPDGPLSLRAKVTIPEISSLEPFIPDMRTAGGTLGMDVDLSGNWQAPVGHVRIDGQNIRVPESVNYGISLLSSDCSQPFVARPSRSCAQVLSRW